MDATGPCSSEVELYHRFYRLAHAALDELGQGSFAPWNNSARELARREAEAVRGLGDEDARRVRDVIRNAISDAELGRRPRW